MATFRELIYLVNDEVKLVSDDSIITEEHIKFLLQKYRALLIYTKYKDLKMQVPLSMYQNICLDLEEIDTFDGLPCIGNKYLRSVDKIPNTLDIGNSSVYPYNDYYADSISFISRKRMKYVGHNRFLKNKIYCSIYPDMHLYFTSSNPQFLMLEKVAFSAVFEDPEEAVKLSCENMAVSCDIMDHKFPIEDSLIPQLTEAVLKEILGAAYRPGDSSNNASDELSSLASFISRNVKSELAKQISE